MLIPAICPKINAYFSRILSENCTCDTNITKREKKLAILTKMCYNYSNKSVCYFHMERVNCVPRTGKTENAEIRQLITEGLAFRADHHYQKADRYFALAARLGSAEALFHAAVNLLDRFRESRASVCSSYELQRQDAEYRQIDYFFRSAEGGYPPAMLRVAEIYRKGCAFFSCNPKKAIYWYTKALRHGEEGAREPLADCYERGFGTDQNSEIAKKIRMGSSNLK